MFVRERIITDKNIFGYKIMSGTTGQFLFGSSKNFNTIFFLNSTISGTCLISLDTHMIRFRRRSRVRLTPKRGPHKLKAGNIGANKATDDANRHWRYQFRIIIIASAITTVELSPCLHKDGKIRVQIGWFTLNDCYV